MRDAGNWIWSVLGLLLILGVYYGLYRLALHAGDDMDSRGENGTPYSLLVFFVPLIGIPYWLMRRRHSRGG